MVAHFGHKRHLLNLPAEGHALIKLAQYQTAGFGPLRQFFQRRKRSARARGGNRLLRMPNTAFGSPETSSLARGWGPKVQYGSDRHMSGGTHSSWQTCLVARWASNAFATFVGICDALGAWPE